MLNSQYVVEITNQEVVDWAKKLTGSIIIHQIMCDAHWLINPTYYQRYRRAYWCIMLGFNLQPPCFFNQASCEEHTFKEYIFKPIGSISTYKVGILSTVVYGMLLKSDKMMWKSLSNDTKFTSNDHVIIIIVTIDFPRDFTSLQLENRVKQYCATAISSFH